MRRRHSEFRWPCVRGKQRLVSDERPSSRRCVSGRWRLRVGFRRPCVPGRWSGERRLARRQLSNGSLSSRQKGSDGGPWSVRSVNVWARSGTAVATDQTILASCSQTARCIWRRCHRLLMSTQCSGAFDAPVDWTPRLPFGELPLRGMKPVPAGTCREASRSIPFKRGFLWMSSTAVGVISSIAIASNMMSMILVS